MLSVTNGAVVRKRGLRSINAEDFLTEESIIEINSGNRRLKTGNGVGKGGVPCIERAGKGKGGKGDRNLRDCIRGDEGGLSNDFGSGGTGMRMCELLGNCP
eukprot:CAMPEP_0171299814 /NCGR_PEP_ID=MMETSP0816-20121228/8685_1 /TAXON_ID=420281 /ORGANISM="Proboscia inermis, Strain CCAP1064/1" /LENGTH=100 /DNA_ID=CAMNT_0011775933 /DNA_START=64 /DNA_END=366 /DNA_ORIENTATION=+